MAGRKRKAPATTKAKADVPDIYGEMLLEAGVGPSMTSSSNHHNQNRTSHLQPSETLPPKPTVQTLDLESDDEDDDDEDEDLEFEDVDIADAGQPSFSFALPTTGHDVAADDAVPGGVELELNLTAHITQRAPAQRRKIISKEERRARLETHKAHLVCLLAHSAGRNHWCNDPQVQDSLRSILPAKTIAYLNPGANLSQFGRTESLKNGLKQASDRFKMAFQITERGLRRALWAENKEQLAQYEPPSDLDSCLDREDFRRAAKELMGSRDVGAQLYCALLRSAGVETRLVCSLQPLPFTAGGPTMPMPKQKPPKASSKQAAYAEKVQAAMALYDRPQQPVAAVASPSARRRLGHPHAASYNMPLARPSPSGSSAPAAAATSPKKLRESPFPVYWVEVLDVAHQKWQPVDPLVTGSMWKPRALEPPATDRENFLAYVVAFEADGTARDVTRRYTKAYTAKTVRARVETADERGDKWWRKALRPLARPSALQTDMDQIEDNELAAAVAREPMPRNVADFKDHPVYALARHLRRHEVLLPDAHEVGTVSAGARAPLERVYRRRDVKLARTRDKWYRLGRVVRPYEIPPKWLPKRASAAQRRKDDDDDDDQDSDGHGDGAGATGENGTPIFTIDQTELYVAPPVRDGKVPRNKFGNVDLYVPSMLPPGGAHVADERAARAAFVLGVDYAPALAGFSFKGRKGTAVFCGVVVPAEAAEAVRAVAEGLAELEEEMVSQERTRRVLGAWRRFLAGLRIRERVGASLGHEERAAEEELGAVVDEEMDDADPEMGSGFADGDYGGGGFLAD